MILSSPFSRQNKSHQTWHHATSGGHTNGQANGYVQQHATLVAKSTPAPRHQLYSSASLRKPAPQQPAPQRPVQAPTHVVQTTNGLAAKTNGVLSPNRHANEPLNMNNRASTLNRLDLLKRRQQQQQQAASPASFASPATISLRRNLSSLGHYPTASSGPVAASNGRPLPRDQIYAPASIASPRELASYHRLSGHLQPIDVQHQHYASTSVHNHPNPHLTPSRSHSSANTNGETHGGRPESALGQLWERFGTLRRKSSWRRWTGGGGGGDGRSWSRQSRGRADTPQSQIYAPAGSLRPASVASGGTVRSLNKGAKGGGAAKQQSIPSAHPHPPGQPLILDPEIYATGKRQVEPEAIYAEGSHALDSNAERRLLEHQLDQPELMAEGETRTLVDEQSQRQPEFRQLVGTLTGWINDELASERIIVRDLQDDLHDGQVLCKLIEKLQQVHLDMVEVTQNEQAQKHKLQMVLATLNRSAFSSQQQQQQQRGTGGWRIRWSVEGIHAKNLVEILHLLIAMALFFRAPLRLPPNVTVTVLVFQKHQGELVRRSHQVELTDEFVSTALDHLGPTAAVAAAAADHSHPLRLRTPHAAEPQRDAFDTLLESAPPEKLNMVKQSLVRFCNRHLNKINMSCHGGQVATAATATGSTCPDLDPHQFGDGLLLVFLIAALEDYFVPLGNLFTRHAPVTFTQDIPPPGTTIGRGMSSTLLPYIDANNNNNNNNNNNQHEPIETPTALEPTSYVNTQPIEKLHNVNVALQLMEDAGLAGIKQRIRAEEIVNGDMKAVLRILYLLFSRYKHL